MHLLRCEIRILGSDLRLKLPKSVGEGTVLLLRHLHESARRPCSYAWHAQTGARGRSSHLAAVGSNIEGRHHGLRIGHEALLVLVHAVDWHAAHAVRRYLRHWIARAHLWLALLVSLVGRLVLGLLHLDGSTLLILNTTSLQHEIQIRLRRL